MVRTSWFCRNPDALWCSAGTLVGAIRTLQKQWPEICEDIKTGTLNSKITDLEVRTAVEKTLKPNPDLAKSIERECSKDDWEGILPRLFPNALFIAAIMSGSMQQYVPALRHFAGDIPCISPSYVASECNFIGLNINPKCAPEDIGYMIWPETSFYEFLPLDNGTKKNALANAAERETVHLVEAANVELGKEYEIVVTNDAGRSPQNARTVSHAWTHENIAWFRVEICHNDV